MSWNFNAESRRDSGPTLPPAPMLGPGGRKYLGRILIEAWDPDDSRADGIKYIVYYEESSEWSAVHNFVRKTIEVLNRRLNGSGGSGSG